MISELRNKLSKESRNEEGFSLAELSVAMLVGIIVFAFAITFLVTFSSSSIRASAKSEVTGKARIAMTRTLKDVSSAANLPTCAQWKNQSIQNDTSITNNLGANLDKCVELISSSQVLLVAKDDAVCWYVSSESGASPMSIAYPEKVACMFADNGYSEATRCRPSAPPAEDVLFYSECNTGSSTPIETRLIAELGPHNPGGPTNAPLRAGPTNPNSLYKRIFTYVNYDSTPFYPNATPPVLNKILKISVNISISYENGNYKNGEKDYSIYNFSQTIQLSGMKAFMETGAYGN